MGTGGRTQTAWRRSNPKKRYGLLTSLTSYLGTRKLRWRLLYAIRAAFRLVGRSWNDFYAWMLDYQDRHLTLDQILARPRTPGKFKGLWDWSRGEYYLDYLKRHGLKPTSRILDYGCGYGRVAIPVLKYQQPGGSYIGTEISRRRLALAREWIAREGLEEKFYELVLSKDNTMPFVADDDIDVVWVLSVFNHMPDAELDACLAAMRRVLRPSGTLFCYYLADIEGGDSSVKTFRRTDEDMARRLEAAGFTHRQADNFDDDLGDNQPPDARMILAFKTVPMRP